MSKSNYKGNFTKDELKVLEAERLEKLEELEAKRLKDSKRRKARGNRHVDWSEGVED